MISNYKKKEDRISSNIDRTISQMMRKEKLVENKIISKTIDPHDFGLAYSIRLNLIQDHLGSLKEVPKWYTHDLVKFKDDEYYRYWYNKCDCCGRPSYNNYCMKCQIENYHQILKERIKDNDFKGALSFILRESRERS